MKIDDLRQIGRQLIEMVPEYRLAKDSRTALKKGASGDRTYPMDRKAEEIIFSAFESFRKPFKIVSEEYGLKNIGKKGLKVLIDPIDGSKNAVAGIPFFSTSIAVAEGNRIGDVCMSYVINLISGDEFWAEKDKGAFLNGIKLETQKSDECNVALYEIQSPFHDLPKIVPLLSLFKRTRCLGSVALDLAHLAMGSASVFVNPVPSRSFDFAGGWLLVREAGGIFTDIKGKPMDSVETGLERSVPLLASANEAVHAKSLKALVLQRHLKR